MPVARIIAAVMVLILASNTANALTDDESDKDTLLKRCDLTALQDRTGSATFYSKTSAKGTIVHKTVRNLKNVEFRFGHQHTNPWISFKNTNKFGVYAVALGFYPYDTMNQCSSDPQRYQAVLFCRGLIPGVGVAAGESGRLECSMKAKAATEHDFCIIGFTPEFESTGTGLAFAMDALGMCD